MNSDAGRDPRIRALAELVHQIRPTWDRTGIRVALHTAATGKPFNELVRAALDAAFDPTANTPATIKKRDGTAWKNGDDHTTRPPVPPPAADVLPTVDPGDYTAGIAAARAAIAAAKKAATENKNKTTNPAPEE